MKLKFTIEIDVPDASDYAKSVFKHVYEDDYVEDTDLGYQICEDILHELTGNWDNIIPNQIPKDYYNKYNNTLNSLI